MATTTTNLSLRKPESSDFVNVALDIAGNMQTIDEKWASSAAANIGSAAAAGSALTVARTDHVHTVGSGTVSAPGLPVGESNTGLYRPGTGQLAAAVAGALAWITSAAGLALEKALHLAHIATPSAPSAGYTAVYGKSDGNLYKQTPAGDEVKILDADIFTAAGDIVYGTGAEAHTPLALGAKGHALLADTSSPKYDPIARRNKVINGDMRVCQRTTLGSTDDTYTLDRWTLLLEAANAATVTQETSDVPTDGSKYALKLTVGSGEDNKFGIATYLEFLDVADLRGKTVSLQAKLKATAAITDVRMAVLEWTGTADTVTSDVVGTWSSAGTNPTLAANWTYLGTPSNLSPTTSWATYKVEGLTVGASANNLAVFIWCEDETTTATTDSLLITDVQLEEGAICTQVERRPYQQELALCRRYFEAFGGAQSVDSFGFGAWVSTTSTRIFMYFTEPKRVQPTVSYSALSDFKIWYAPSGGADIAPSAISIAQGGHTTFCLAVDVGSAVGTAGGHAAMYSASTTAARLFANAEL